MSENAGYERGTVLVDGRWTPTATRTEVFNPATAAVIGTAAGSTAADVDRAATAARAAGTRWARTTPVRRAKYLRRLHALLRERRDQLVQVIVAEVGAPVRTARSAHVDLALDVLVSFAELAERWDDERIGNSLVIRQAAGVVAAITPWNYPLYQLMAKVAPALAAGCSVIVKPAELTPLSAYLLADAIVDAEFPPGVVNLLPGSGSVVGGALVAHPMVNVVSFTGSTQVGRQVGAAAGAALKRVSLELGGKSASIVLPGADLVAAVRATVESAAFNSGQTCSANTRLIVPVASYADALAIAEARALELVVGDPTLEGTDLGPLISAEQRVRVHGFVKRAVADGARVLTGGTVPEGAGHFYPPTVIADADPHAEIAQEEVFGPVLTVLSYHGDTDEAIRLANDSRYGLAGAVWGPDTESALAAARRLQTGQVDVNGAPFNVRAPFGGWKASGIGRELGGHGLEEFCETTAIQLPRPTEESCPGRPATR